MLWVVSGPSPSYQSNVCFWVVKRTFNYEHPGYAGNLVIIFASIPSLPNLISQFLINQ